MAQAKQPLPTKKSPQNVRGPNTINLDDEGREILSNVSRVTVGFLPTIGERVRRFMRNPQLLKDVYENPDLWDDEDAEVLFTESGLRTEISVHEDRFQEGLKQAKAKQAERDEEKKQQDIQKRKDDQMAFRAAVREAIKEGETPPKPAPKTEA